MVGNISVWGTTTKGKTIELIRIDSRKVHAYLINDKPTKLAGLEIGTDYWDRKYGDAEIHPGETARGMLLLAYPKDVDADEEVNPDFRIVIKDTAGNSVQGSMLIDRSNSTTISKLKTPTEWTSFSGYVARHWDDSITVRMR